MAEIWKKVVGYEGLYEVSDQGRVRSVERYVNHSTKGVFRLVRERILKPWNFYDCLDKSKVVATGVDLCKDGKVTKHLVHRLVLVAFLGLPQSGHVCCHGDSDPRNNRLSNLRWDTYAANEADKVPQGTDNRTRIAKLNPDKVREIRRLWDSNQRSCSQLAKDYNVNSGTVYYVVHRRTWRDVVS